MNGFWEKTTSQTSSNSNSSKSNKSNKKNKNRNDVTRTTTKIRYVRPRRTSWRRRRFARSRATFNTTTRSQESRIEHFVQEFPISTDSDGVYDSSILFAPSKWTSSRIGALSRLYQGWRPRTLRITYIPYVATVESGNLTIGTVWNGNRFYSGPDMDYYASALIQTPGSFSTCIYTKKFSNVRLGTQLRTNIFPTSQVSEDEIPFVIAVYVNCSVKSTVVGKIILSGDIQLTGPTITGASPASYSGTINLTHTDDPNETTFQVPIDDLSTTAIGTDYKFQAARPLFGNGDSIILRRFSTFVARIKQIANGIATLTADKAFPTAALPVNLIGLTSNF